MNLKLFRACWFWSLLLIPSSALAADTNDLTRGENPKPCFYCKGSGEVKCPRPGCVDGKVECPGPCLKFSQGTWIHMDVKGHSPDELWRNFEDKDHGGGSVAWNQHHLGEVIEYQNGRAVNVGRCKICGGTTKASCPVCKGKSAIVCPVCGGEKVVPESWSFLENPKIKVRPYHFKMKDGSEIDGYKIMEQGGVTTVRVADGEMKLNRRDVVSEARLPSQK